MLPEIATLKERMSKGGDWMKFRREIATLHDKANTQAEFVELMEAFAVLGDLIEQVYDAETAKEIRDIYNKEYLFLLNKEAMENGEQINPKLLAQIVAREVDSGRLDPSDEFVTLSQDGGEVLGDSCVVTAKRKRRGDVLALVLSVLALILWAMSIEPIGISPLWLILIGFFAGWFINDREIQEIKLSAEAARAARGY